MKAVSINVTDVIERANTSPLQYLIVALCSLVLFVGGFDTEAMSVNRSKYGAF